MKLRILFTLVLVLCLSFALAVAQTSNDKAPKSDTKTSCCVKGAKMTKTGSAQECTAAQKASMKECAGMDKAKCEKMKASGKMDCCTKKAKKSEVKNSAAKKDVRLTDVPGKNAQ